MTEDEQTQLEIETSRGAAAERLMNAPLLREAFARLEEGIMDAWRTSPVRDTEGQLGLRLMMKAATDVQAYIRDIVQTGKMANISLDRERTLRERAQAAVRELRRA